MVFCLPYFDTVLGVTYYLLNVTETRVKLWQCGAPVTNNSFTRKKKLN